MNVNEGKHQAKLLEWKDRAADGGSGGMDVKRGRAENGCSPKTYDRWEQEILGKVRQIAKTQFLAGVAERPLRYARRSCDPSNIRVPDSLRYPLILYPVCY